MEQTVTPVAKYGGLQVREDDCSYVWYIAPDKRCEWVKKQENCRTDSVIQYGRLLFCVFSDSSLFPLGLFVLILWLLYLFLILGTTADNFFCPSLSVIADVLRLSENIAGVTILAFGNGAPDIFTSLVADEREMIIMFTELIGAGIFVTAVIAGSVALVSPFRIPFNSFTRNCCFYILAVSWICYVSEDQIIYLWEALSLILLYIIFIVLVVGMQCYENREEKQKGRIPRLQDPELLKTYVAYRADHGRSDAGPSAGLTLRSRAYSLRAKLGTTKASCFRIRCDLSTVTGSATAKCPYNARKALALRVTEFLDRCVENFRYRYVAIATELAMRRRMAGAAAGTSTSGQRTDDVDDTSPSSARPTGLFRELIYDINPINAQDWRNGSIFVKAILVLRAPVTFLLQVLIPVVNETAQKRGWSKLLNCIQLAITPVCALVKLEVWHVHIGPVPILAITFVLGLALAVYVFAKTERNRCPKYHNGFAFLGFVSAMLVVYVIANEVMAVLLCVGYASGITNAMLGITLLAWGNSVGDLISNVAVARRGFPRMGYSACFGGPLFNTLLGLGLSWTVAATRHDNYRTKIRTSDMMPGCLTFLLASLVASLIYLNVSGFLARRSYGYLLFTLYFAFVLINVLSEVHYIHPLGTDHRDD